MAPVRDGWNITDLRTSSLELDARGINTTAAPKANAPAYLPDQLPKRQFNVTDHLLHTRTANLTRGNVLRRDVNTTDVGLRERQSNLTVDYGLRTPAAKSSDVILLRREFNTTGPTIVQRESNLTVDYGLPKRQSGAHDLGLLEPEANYTGSGLVQRALNHSETLTGHLPHTRAFNTTTVTLLKRELNFTDGDLVKRGSNLTNLLNDLGLLKREPNLTSLSLSTRESNTTDNLLSARSANLTSLLSGRSSNLSTLLTPRAQVLSARTTVDPAIGVTDPKSINNNAIFALFGLIGVGFVCTGIWFFFWAKNGGFYFKDNDWDDYKSTVLRRKGPNGTTLSGATESTDLGGGSVYKDHDVESSVGSEMREVKMRGGRGSRSEKGGRKGRKSKRYDEESEVGYEGNGGVDDDMRAYRHEKPARVGGINRQADSTQWDGSTRDGVSTVDSQSDLLTNREHTPTNTPKKAVDARIRKVSSQGRSSFWNRSSTKKDVGTKKKNDDRVKAEAKRLQEEGRAARSSKRDFSFAAGDDASTVVSEDAAREARRAARRERHESRRASRSPVKKVESRAYAESEADTGDLGTKSYRHVIPGLSIAAESSVGTESVVGSEYADERRRKRAGGKGYRRGGASRRDSLSESDRE